MTTPPPVVPGRHESYSLVEMMPAAPRKKRTGLIVGIAVALAVVAGFAAAGVLILGGDEAEPAAAAATSASPSADPAAVVECTNIERAYNAWSNIDLPSTAFDVGQLNTYTIERLAEDGKDFLKAVEGYADKPSKSLAVAVANYNVEMAMANLQATAMDGVEAGQAEKTFTAITKVHAEFTAFKLATCA